jgi:hypothetical protein
MTLQSGLYVMGGTYVRRTDAAIELVYWTSHNGRRNPG